MTLKTIQNEVDGRIGQYKEGYRSPLQIISQMTEELGEVARATNYIHSHKKPKPGEKTEYLGEEIADLLFAAVCLANSHNIDMDAERKKMMEEKRYKRDDKRFEKK